MDIGVGAPLGRGGAARDTGQGALMRFPLDPDGDRIGRPARCFGDADICHAEGINRMS